VEELSGVYQEHFGECPDGTKLWEFSRALFMLITKLALEKPVSLPGIGAFQIHRKKPRKSGFSDVDAIPSLRWKTSVRLNAVVADAFGIALPSPKEDEPELFPEEKAEVLQEVQKEFVEEDLNRKTSLDDAFLY
jgi:hypothetical protein